MGYSKASEYKVKMETQAKEQQEAIDFGNYMKEDNPKTLERWRKKHREWTVYSSHEHLSTLS